jgi:trimeric autotransporter adhesin
MLRIRFICVAAATLSIASVAAAGSANAQNASTDPSNTPSLLTQLFSQAAAPAPASAATVPASTAAPPVKATRSRRVASRRHRGTADTKQATNQHGAPPAASAQNNASADAWLAASAPPANASPTNSAPASTQATADAPQMAEPAQQDSAPSASSVSSVVVGGQTVQIAEADQVNEIDLTASSAPASTSTGGAPVSNALATNAPSDAIKGPSLQSTMETTLPRGDRADVIGAAAVKAAQADATQTAFAAAAPNAGGATIADPGTPDPAAQGSGAQSINDQTAAAQNSGAQVFSAEASSAAHGAAWIAQLLAALGGALTAGIVGWFLIGAEPVRNYG